MSTETRGRVRQRAQVIRIGTFRLHGSDRPRLTISSRLDCEAFPNTIGDEVTVDLVGAGTDDEHLEIRPAEHE